MSIVGVGKIGIACAIAILMRVSIAMPLLSSEPRLIPNLRSLEDSERGLPDRPRREQGFRRGRGYSTRRLFFGMSTGNWHVRYSTIATILYIYIYIYFYSNDFSPLSLPSNIQRATILKSSIDNFPFRGNGQDGQIRGGNSKFQKWLETRNTRGRATGWKERVRVPRRKGKGGTNFWDR